MGTQLGIGPMSRLCIDAAIELANEQRRFLMLVASRRQIECEEQSGGYVWTTDAFARYVRERDVGGYVMLCRDHAGPWQHPSEAEMLLVDAMASAKASLAEDIRCGFDILHLDPSVNLQGTEAMLALEELHSFCQAKVGGREIAFEVGTEAQSGHVQSADELRSFLEAFTGQPMFVVAQTGTLVKEMRNVGDFAVPDPALAPQIRALVTVAQQRGARLKEHNADYLSGGALRLRPLLGIGAINVGPMLGVEHTRCLLRICANTDLVDVAERFLELAYNSHKWEKWMLPHSTASVRDKAIIAGHYVFGTEEFGIMYQHILHSAKYVPERIKSHLKLKIREIYDEIA